MNNIFYSILIFIFGLFVGSFLNCVIDRIFKKESFIKGRSYCSNCKKTLKAIDLIPVFSYLFLSGKCRYCNSKISWQYPLSELLTGIIFLGVYIYSPTVLLLVFNILMSSFLILLFLSDIKYMLIPDRLLLIPIAFSFVFNIILDLINGNNLLSWDSFFINGNLGALIAGGFFGLIVLISKEKWMGKGDIFLGVIIGLFLGWTNTIIAMFLSFIIGSLISLVLVFLKKKGFKSEVPFSPFLLGGSWIALFWGKEILSWYLNLIF